MYSNIVCSNDCNATKVNYTRVFETLGVVEYIFKISQWENNGAILDVERLNKEKIGDNLLLILDNLTEAREMVEVQQVTHKVGLKINYKKQK